jgi:hypothetical protein
MKYRLVYDVMNDGFPWFGVMLTIVPLLLALAYCLEIGERLRDRRSSPAAGRPGSIETLLLPMLIVSTAVLGLFGLFVAAKMHEGLLSRQQCKEWAQAGVYQVTEGNVADYQYRRAGSSFRVADSSFDLLGRSAGFTGRFNAPGARHDSLRDGLLVRLSHRDGFILRVEIAP